MKEAEEQPPVISPEPGVGDGTKPRWSAPEVTILDAKETLTGAPAAFEETPTDKLGS